MQYAGKLLLVDINNQLQFLINIIEDENGYHPKSTGRKTNIIYICKTIGARFCKNCIVVEKSHISVY